MNKVEFKYHNGDVLKDVVTGLEGVVMVCARYSTGCSHYGLLSQGLKDGSPRDWEWIDESRLELVREKQRVKFNIDPLNTSGPSPSGPQL